ncbi:hypothetical protein LTR66_015491, partial [Elasticomyces elasticus]
YPTNTTSDYPGTPQTGSPSTGIQDFTDTQAVAVAPILSKRELHEIRKRGSKHSMRSVSPSHSHRVTKKSSSRSLHSTRSLRRQADKAATHDWRPLGSTLAQQETMSQQEEEQEDQQSALGPITEVDAGEGEFTTADNVGEY